MKRRIQRAFLSNPYRLRILSGLFTLSMILVFSLSVYASAKTPSIRLSASKVTLNLRKTKTKKLKATLKNTSKNTPVKWKSSNTGVVKVSSGGVLTAKKTGKAVITASIKTSSGTKKATCKVTVVKKYTISQLEKIVQKAVRKKYGKKYKAMEFRTEEKTLSFTVRYQGGNTANILAGFGRINRKTAKVTFL